MAVIKRWALELRPGGISGISIASLLTTPAWGLECCRSWSETELLNWTRLGLDRLGWRLWIPASRPSSSLMEVSASLIRKGSSASANCSAMSPVSVQDKSESAESEECRSWEEGWCRCSASSDVDCWSGSGRVRRVRKGILDGRRVGFLEGILEMSGLLSSSTLLQSR